MKKTKKKLIIHELTEEEINDLIQDLLIEAGDFKRD